MGLKQKAQRTKQFASDHAYEIVYVSYLVGCFALGYWGTKKYLQAYNAQVQQAVDHATLFNAAAAGHEFQFDPNTNTLWDVTIRPDMKTG